MKRIKNAAILFIVACLLVSLCACAAGAKPKTAETSQTERPDDTILTDLQTEAPEEKPESFTMAYLPEQGFNPFSCTSLTNRTVFSLLYESLFTVTGDLHVEPVLCDTFSVSEDQLTYRFELISSVTFSDGSPLTAEDVVKSLIAAQTSSYYAARLKHISYISASGDFTISILLDTPFENLPLVLDIPIIKASTLQEQMPIGTGPYFIKKNGAEILLQQDTEWWQQGSPVVDVDQISMVAASTANEIRDAFEFGSIDLVCTDPNAAYAAGYHCNYEVWDCTTTNMQYLGFNLASNIFATDELRCAVTYAINRAQITKNLMNGSAAETSIPCIPGSPYYDDSLAASYNYAPEKFEKALQASGIRTKDSPGIFLVCSEDPIRVEIAQYIAQELESYGLYLKVEALDYANYVKALKANQFDVYYGEVKLTANFDLGCFYDADGKLSFGSIFDPSLSEQCREALENSGNYHTLFSNIMRDGAICPVLFKKYAVYMSRGTVAYLDPAIDNVLHTAGGRTLADASVPFESEQAATQQTEAEP